jgi:hypothetical protein
MAFFYSFSASLVGPAARVITAILPTSPTIYRIAALFSRPSWKWVGKPEVITCKGAIPMIENLSKKLEVCAHVGIILMTFLVGYAVVRLQTFSEAPTGQNPYASARRGLAAGMKIPTPGIDWGKYDRTLLLVLSSACKSCKESATFYQKIIEELRSIKNVRLVAVFPQIETQDVTQSKQYLEEMGLAIDEVKQVMPGSVGVTGLPALVLVDNTGTVRNVWVGKISVEREIEVIDALKCTHC